MTEREALAEIYTQISFSLTRGDIRINLVENDAEDMPAADAALLERIMDRVAAQMRAKADAFRASPRKRGER